MPRVRRPLRARATLAAVLTGLVATVLTGCSDDGSSSPAPRPTDTAVDQGTPLDDVDTTTLLVRRAPFCDLVEPAAVTRALGEEAVDLATHRSGQRTRIPDG